MDKFAALCAEDWHENFLLLLWRSFLLFCREHLRKQRAGDLCRALGITVMRDFTAFLGSLDYQHWRLNNCPVAWIGEFKGKKKNPAIAIKSVADTKLWACACRFGKPGTLNDSNIHDAFPIMSSILDGRLLPDFEHCVNENRYRSLYFLADGIYPPYSVFVNTIMEMGTRREQAFAHA